VRDVARNVPNAAVGVPPSLDEIEARLTSARAVRERRERIAAVVFPTAALVLCFVLWEAGSRLLGIPSYLLPAPGAIVQSMFAHGSLLLKESVLTAWEIVLGFSLSIVVGIPLALAIFVWPGFSRTILPLLVSSQAVPKVAVAPLFLVWFGFGLLPKVLIAFLIAFFPIVINTAMGLAAIEREKVYLAQSMGLGAWATFFKIRLPNALPSIFAGLKISITLAVVGAVVGEFVGGQGGLGHLLLVANGNMDTALLFAGIVALTIVGVVLYGLIVLVERLVLPPHAISATIGARESM
jgi:NitT/TauT family transport system permease protein